jgi:hypothetical protein
MLNKQRWLFFNLILKFKGDEPIADNELRQLDYDPLAIVWILFGASAETLDFSLARLLRKRSGSRILPLASKSVRSVG